MTINSIGGSGTVQLNKNGFVTIKAASDEVNATLTSLDGSKLTTAENVSASVTIAGALAEAKEELTPLQVKLAELSRILTIMVLSLIHI